jgi:hypothetical protein
MTDRPSVALRQLGPRETATTPALPNALENVITAELSEGAEAFIDGNRSVYRLKLGDQSTPLLGDALLPTPEGAGLWVEQAAHNTLSRVLTTELAADVLVGAGLTVELLSLTVPAVGHSYVDAIAQLSATWTATGDLELQLFVSVDGGAFTEVNAGAVQSGADTQRRGIAVSAATGAYAVAVNEVTISLRLRNGLATDVTVSPAGGNAASLRVQVRRASVASIEPGILWYGSGTLGSANNLFMLGYLPNEYESPVSVAPKLVLSPANVNGRMYRLRSDPTDPTKVWVLETGATASGHYLMRFSRSSLGEDCVPTPEAAIELNPVRTFANFCVDFAFTTTTGKCIVATAGTIRVYNVSQLTTTGTPVPTAVITVASANVIQGILIDGDDVWVACYSTSFLFKLSAAQLAGAGGVVVPPIILTGSNMLGGAEYMDYDSLGNLWVTFYDVSELRCYPPAALLASGNPVPSVVIDISGITTGAFGVAVDDEDNIFVSNNDNGALYKFLQSQTTSSGTKVPAVTFSTQGLIASGGTLTLDRGTP